MANEPPQPPLTTRTKRWREQMALLQYALRCAESINRARDALDNIIRILVEEQAESTPTSPRPLPSPLPARPSQKPTQFQPAMSSDRFGDLCRIRFAEARREDERQAVRDMVKKGGETGVIAPGVVAVLLEEFKKQ